MDVAPLMRLSRVSLVFPTGTQALADVDLVVEHGQFVAIVGPSGCGKSTLLRAVAGLEPVSSGTLNAPSKGVAFVFQDANLLPWRTIRANVALPLELSGESNAAARADESLARVGLVGFFDHYPRELSGGMRMRASLARALVTRPQVLLLDEPFGALDEITRYRLQDDLLTLHAELGFTALFVTHSVFEASYLADRVVIMSARPGRIVGDLPIHLDRPRAASLRTDPGFGPIVQSVTDVLRAQLQPCNRNRSCRFSRRSACSWRSSSPGRPSSPSSPCPSSSCPPRPMSPRPW